MKYTIDRLPEWLVIEQKIVGCEAVSALEKFIHNNEPAGTDSAWLWRKHLCEALNEAIEQTHPEDKSKI